VRVPRLPLAALLLLLFAAASVPNHVLGQEADDWGDEGGDGGDDAGFADFPSTPTPTKAEAPPAVSPLTLMGTTRADFGAWTERFGSAPADAPSLPGGNDNPFGKGRVSVDLELRYKADAVRAVVAIHGEHDLAMLYREGEYDPATTRAYRHLRDPLLGDIPMQLREALVATSVGDFEVTLGRQIVAWGEGDGLSPLDIVNPRDMREPGLSDLDDIRIPVLASRLGWFKGNHRVEAMITHEAHWGFRSPPLGPFSPFPSIIGKSMQDNPIVKQLDINVVEKMRGHDVDFSDNIDGVSPAAWQYLGRWVYKGEGIDLGLYAASVIDRQGIISMDAAGQMDLFGKVMNPDPQDIRLHMRHLRYALFGTSGAWAYGSLLLKWELAFEKSRPYNVGGFESLGARRADQVDLMLGITYNGISNTMIGIEASKVVLLTDLGELLFPMDAPFLMLRAQHKALRDRLTIMAVASMIGATAEYGALGRIDATYELADGWKASAGYVTFQPGDEISPFSGLDRHDRAMVKLRWDFRIL